MYLFLNADGGGDKNHRFDRVQAHLLWLAHTFNLEKIVDTKTAAGRSYWNPVERAMSPP